MTWHSAKIQLLSWSMAGSLFLLNALSATPYIYVCNAGSPSRVTVQDVAGIVPTSVVNMTGNQPHQLVISPDNAFTYVTNQLGNVSVIFNTSRTVINTIPMVTTPRGIAITPDNQQLYVCNISGSVAVYNILTQTTTTIADPLFDILKGIAVSPDGSFAYVCSGGLQGFLVIIDVATNTVIGSILLPTISPEYVVFDPSGAFAYVTTFAQSILKINVSTAAVSTLTMPPLDFFGFTSEGIAITPDGSKVFVGNTSQQNIAVYNTLTDSWSKITTASQPQFVTITPDGSSAFVSNRGGNSVSEIDVASETVVNTFNGFFSPEGIATPPTVPFQPTNLVATPGDQQATITFTPGLNGQSQIVDYQYSIDNGVTWVSILPADTSSPVTITGLPNGVTYSIRLRAINLVGYGTPSDPVTVTPRAEAPSGFLGTVLFDKKSEKTTLSLHWTGSPSSSVVQYKVLAHGHTVKTVPADEMATIISLEPQHPSAHLSHSYRNYLQQKYTVVAVSENGAESLPAFLTIEN